MSKLEDALREAEQESKSTLRQLLLAKEPAYTLKEVLQMMYVDALMLHGEDGQPIRAIHAEQQP